MNNYTQKIEELTTIIQNAQAELAEVTKAANFAKQTHAQEIVNSWNLSEGTSLIMFSKSQIPATWYDVYFRVWTITKLDPNNSRIHFKEAYVAELDYRTVARIQYDSCQFTDIERINSEAAVYVIDANTLHIVQTIMFDLNINMNKLVDLQEYIAKNAIKKL